MKYGKIILGSLIAALASSSYAATKANSVDFTLGGGYAYFSSKRHIQNAGVGFGALAYNFTNHWGIEGLLGGFNSKSNYTNTYHQQVKGAMFAIDGLYHFSYSPSLEPYLLAGVGVIGLNPSGNEAHNQGNINAGVGLQWFVNQVVAFRVEGRDFYTITGGKNDVMIDAGLKFIWDLC